MILPDTRTVLHLRLALALGGWAAASYSAMTVFSEGIDGLINGWVLMVIIAVAVGAITSAIIGTWQWRTYGTGRVRIRRTVVVDAPVADVLRRAADAAPDLGARAPRIDGRAGTVDLRVPPSPLSWGRRSRVAAVAEGTGTRVTVTCRPLFPLTVTDVGKGAEHVARLLEAIEPIAV